MKWLPLPKIAHGIAIYPFNPSTLLSSSTSSRPTSIQTQQQDDASISSTSSLADQHSSQNQEDYSHLTPLEVGDEVFIIEQQGQWYRGYVLSTVEEGKKPNRAPLGCFPRTHVQIKEEIEIDIDESYNVTMRQQPQKRRGDEFFGRPLSDIASAPALPRSFSESWIQQAPTEHFPNRPGSLSDLHLDIEHASSEARHIPPPSLPLARFNQSTITGASEPLVDEIAACISEWNSLLYTYINERRYTTFNAVRDSINYLFQARRQLLDQALSREELVKLRKEIVHRIVICNLDQKQQMIVRHPEKGHLLDATNASLSNIYRMHYKYATLPKSVTNICQTATAAAINNASNTSLNNSNASIVNMECESNLLDDTTNSNVSSPSILAGPNSGSPSLSIPNAPGSQQVNQQPQPTIQQHKGAKFYHLFFELKACIAHFCQPGELTELFFSLYSSTERKFLTEQFNVVLNYNGMPREESQIGKLQTLFVDLSLHDISDDLYMVCHVARFGGMKFNEGKDHFATFGSHTSQLFHPNKHQPFQNRGQSAISATVRRPFGCAVLKLTSLLLPQNQQVQKEGDILDYDMPIYTAVSEATYTTLHEDIIFNNVKEFAKNPRAEMLRVSLRTFYGFLDEVLKTNTALLHNVPHTLRLGFADVAFPNDSRNELYMKLEMGDLSQFSRSRNIQVTMCVRDNKTGEVIEDAISTGSGTKPVSFWESMVMYHEQKPKWGEQIKISIQDVYQWERSHVFITIKHRSSNFSGSPGSNTIGSANTSMSSSSSGGEKIVAIGFVPLFLPPYHRDFIADGSHTICLYKSDRPNPSPKSYLDNTPWCARSTAPSNMMQSTADSKANSRFYRNNNNSKPSHRHTPSTHSLKSANGSFHSTTSHQKSLNLANNNSDVSLPQQALSSSNASINGSSAKLVALRDTVTLSTFLCSNIFTQNKTLVKLLNWRTLVEGFGDGANELLSVLDQFTFVGEMEVVKFLGDIFDALLDILAYQYDELNEQAEGLHDEISDQVLAAIIWLLSIVQDRRFSNFRPVLDVYIENRFSVKENEQPSMSDKETQNHNSRLHETTYESLIKSLSRLCENPGDSAKAKLLRSSIKVWDYLFRFIVRSRLNQQFQENENKRIKNNALFKRELENVFNAITSIMGPNQPNAMIGTQTLTLQHFADILAELHAIFMPTEILDIAVSFVDACAHVTGRLVGFKLFMILSMVKSSTFDDPSVRLDFSKNVLQWVGFWVNSYMATAKDVIFSRQAEQQSIPDNLNTQQTRLPRGQWIENLRLSLTVISELLEKVRKAFGMASSGLTSSCIASPSLSNFSRPTSFATVLGEDDQEYSQPDLCAIMEAALQLLPQLLNAYRDIQRLTIQAIHVASSSPIADNASAGSINNGQFRPASRQSFSLLRERSGSISSASVSNPLSKGVHVAPELLQEIPTNQLHRSPSVVSSAAAGPTHMGSSSTLNTLSTANTAGTVKGIPESAQSKFTVTLQALSTSPCAPFPSTYPFQPSSRAVNNAGTSTASSASPNSANDGLTNDHMAMISTGLLDLTVVILELFYLTPGQQWSAFIRKMYEQNGVEDTAEFLRKVVYTCMGILFGDNVMLLEESSLTVDGMMRCEQDETRGHRKIPDNWFNLNAISHQIVLCHILEPIKSTFDLPDFMPNERAYMEDDGILHEEDEDENSKSRNAIAEQRSTLLLWRIYFVGFLRVVGSPRVELTEFMPQAQRAAWKIMGNMRGEVGANVFLSLWNLAGKARLNHEPIKSAALPQTQTDYFGPEFSLPSLTSHSPFSSVILEHGYFDDSLRKSMASIEEDYENEYNTNRNSHVSSTPSNSTYSVRHSVRIGPTDELPLSSIHEERLNDDGIIKSDVSFLQADIAYFILGPLCSVALTLHDRVRINALSLIADVIAIELYSFGELSHVQHALLSTLDRLVMSENKGDDLICSKITIELANAIEKRLLTDNRRDLLIFGRRAVDSICRFLSLLLQIRSLPADDEFMDERITATLKLMKFIQVIEREEIYIKYVHQLVQLHLDSRNFIEAALTMRFHADLLQWDPSDKLIDIPELGLPIQSSFSRKEALYSKMITYLDQGSAWELCIELCKELAYEYENTIYDYNKLSDILQRQASLTENIVKKERYYTEYFRVGFYGRGFPASNRNRQYIYRGLEWEKMSSFVERMQNRHPNAQLLPSKMSNSMTITDEQLKELDSALDGQYLQITPVTAIADVDLISCLSNPNTPESIKKYYSFNNVSKFSFSRPIVKENDPSDKPEDKPESEVLNLWTEKIEFICEDRFPTIVRRSKIVSSHSQLISPIENAVLAMENKNKELMALDKKYSAYIPRGNRRAPVLSQPININPFSMSLNGAVDAPVNGGVPLYKRAFLTKEYWDKNPEMHHWIDRLQMAIYDQVRVIQKCLETHNKLVSSEMRPFHTTLTEFFHKNFAEEIKFIKENHLKQEQQKDKQLLSIVTQSNNRRRSTLSSNATENSSTHSHQHALQQQPLEDMKPMSLASSRQGSTSLASTIQAPGRVNTPALPQIPTMSPISRAFSISTPVADPLSLSGSNAYHSTAFENATMSRAESLSRTLKMSLKKKSRKKSQSSSNSTNTMNSNNTANSIIHKP